MKEKQAAGFEEKEHTADLEVHVWGKDLCDLLVQAATGMNVIAGICLDHTRRVSRSLSWQYSDAEGLLVSFLSEILYLGEMEGLGFDGFELSLDDDQMHAQLSGAPILSIKKEIKAVTYHNLRVDHSPHGLEAFIVFDV